ncbi:unnamed protein product, partial [Gadus morhua 'NCC']
GGGTCHVAKLPKVYINSVVLYHGKVAVALLYPQLMLKPVKPCDAVRTCNNGIARIPISSRGLKSINSDTIPSVSMEYIE